ncbi:hypothetical protein EYF80_004712 [Liparis tanakae]|uniref:Uncharacterized protein n=1 Tax=Liparis tanakae TaxID=230148 RepID=A0A4Z2J5X0_9TELE|nr:hypothetical protein EYF80_004712 [Liparis tanakae]
MPSCGGDIKATQNIISSSLSVMFLMSLMSLPVILHLSNRSPQCGLLYCPSSLICLCFLSCSLSPSSVMQLLWEER